MTAQCQASGDKPRRTLGVPQSGSVHGNSKAPSLSLGPGQVLNLRFTDPTWWQLSLSGCGQGRSQEMHLTGTQGARVSLCLPSSQDIPPGSLLLSVLPGALCSRETQPPAAWRCPALTQLMAARLARELDDQQLFALEAAANAVGACHVGAARGRASQHPHQLLVGVMREEQEGGWGPRRRRLRSLQAACNRSARVSLCPPGAVPTLPAPSAQRPRSPWEAPPATTCLSVGNKNALLDT